MSDAEPKPLRLYTVTLTAEVVVLATDPSDAMTQAINARYDEEEWDAIPSDLRELPDSWEGDSCPFGRQHPEHAHATIDELISLGCAPKWSGT